MNVLLCLCLGDNPLHVLRIFQMRNVNQCITSIMKTAASNEGKMFENQNCIREFHKPFRATLRSW